MQCVGCFGLGVSLFGQTVEEIHVSQEAEAEGTGCQQLTAGRMRL